MTHPFAASNAPYGPTAPSLDMVPLEAPASDTALSLPCRSFLVLTDGTVSVTTAAGNDRTFTATSGMMVACCITHVLAATTADILLYQ
jgi:hypothetical protein